ncbi:hypothetical protein V6N13_105057 [Hibiscus sabdariffa]|uniref:Uncharacterized protein n=1 Tax=Hibiscus sabdariffa TaxID=183260 RepID=A0ABR2SJ72_9ROSI
MPAKRLLARARRTPWGFKKEGDKHGHTRGCIVDLPESGSCGSDRSRGCIVDLSRSGKFGFYKYTYWFKSPLLEPVAPPSALMRKGKGMDTSEGATWNFL